MALLFGPPGIGKSVLAVQIGDALARGRPIDGFEGPRRRHKVLYVDLGHSDDQFRTRYSRFSEWGLHLRSFRFAERFYRGRPLSGEDLFEWLRKRIADDEFEAVIVDSLSMLRRTLDGAREAITLMQRLRELQEHFGVSMLVLAVSDPSPRDRFISEAQLKRSRAILGLADTAFALDSAPESADTRRLIHIRNCGPPEYWPEAGVPYGSIRQRSDGMIEFNFENDWATEMDDATRSLVCRIHKCRQSGTTFRQIATELGISKSRAARLAGKWNEYLEDW